MVLLVSLSVCGCCLFRRHSGLSIAWYCSMALSVSVCAFWNFVNSICINWTLNFEKQIWNCCRSIFCIAFFYKLDFVKHLWWRLVRSYRSCDIRLCLNWVLINGIFMNWWILLTVFYCYSIFCIVLSLDAILLHLCCMNYFVHITVVRSWMILLVCFCWKSMWCNCRFSYYCFLF